jgi:hypothetical protein
MSLRPDAVYQPDQQGLQGKEDPNDQEKTQSVGRRLLGNICQT